MYVLLLKYPYGDNGSSNEVCAASEDKDKLIEFAKNEDLDLSIWFGSEHLVEGSSCDDRYFDIEKLKVI